LTYRQDQTAASLRKRERAPFPAHRFGHLSNARLAPFPVKEMLGKLDPPFELGRRIDVLGPEVAHEQRRYQFARSCSLGFRKRWNFVYEFARQAPTDLSSLYSMAASVFFSVGIR
jgi:hypothetical protein